MKIRVSTVRFRPWPPLTNQARLNKQIIEGMSSDLAKARDEAAFQEGRANTGIASYRMKFKRCVHDAQDLAQTLEGTGAELDACRDTVLGLNGDVEAATRQVAALQGELAMLQSRLPSVVGATQHEFREAVGPDLPPDRDGLTLSRLNYPGHVPVAYGALPHQQ